MREREAAARKKLLINIHEECGFTRIALGN